MNKNFIISTVLMMACAPSAFAQTTRNEAIHCDAHTDAELSMNKISFAFAALAPEEKKPSYYIDGYRYNIIDEAKKEVELTKLDKSTDDEKPNTYSGDAVIPEKVKINNVEYTVVGIANSAFFLKNLTSVKFPETLRYIGDFAFYLNDNIKEIVLPDALETIGGYAFQFCNRLRKLTLGKSLKSIGYEAFYDCWYLENITVKEGNKHFKTIDGILYDYNATTLYKCPAYRKDVTKVKLPETLKTITVGAMMYCEYFTEITLPEGLEVIEAEAFRSCIKVEEFYIPSTVKEIKSGNAFANCASLKNFKVADTNAAYCNWNGHLYTKDKKVLVNYSSAGVDADGVAAIAEGTEKIFKGAFAYNKNVKKVIMPNTVTAIESMNFVDNKELVSVTFSDKIEHLGSEIFSITKSVQELYIGSAIKDMYSNTFSGCNEVKKVTVNCQTPPVINESEDELADDLFNENVYEGAVLFVPKGTLAAYKGAAVWKNFSDIKELDKPVTSSVDNIEAGNTEVSVSGNRLTVSSSKPTTIAVYDAAGRSLFNSVQTKSATTYLPHGIYVVKVGKTAHKIAI